MSKDEIKDALKYYITKMYEANEIQEIERLSKQLKDKITDYIEKHPELEPPIIYSELKLDAVIQHAQSKLTATKEAKSYWEELAISDYNAILTVFELPHQ